MLATLSRWRRGFKSHRGRCASRESGVGRAKKETVSFLPTHYFLQTPLSNSVSARNSRPSGATGRHATLRTSCSSWAWEFDSPLGHCRQGRRPTGFHKAGMPGSLPGSANEIDPVVKRHDTSTTCWGRWFNSIRDYCWFFGLWRYSSYKKISRLSSKEPVTAKASQVGGQEFFS